MEVVHVYSDGGCAPTNPGPGGWGALITYESGSVEELYGGESFTTNNRMELTAAIMALRHLPERSTVVIHADSSYVVNLWGIKKIKDGRATGQKNHDLWLELHEQVKRHKVDLVWVKGHSGDPGNERADILADIGRLSAGTTVDPKDFNNE